MATAKAGSVVQDGLGQQVLPVEYTSVKKGRKLRLPPVLEAWPVLVLLPSHEEGGILLAGGCDKPSPFAGHTAHARERHHV